MPCPRGFALLLATALFFCGGLPDSSRAAPSPAAAPSPGEAPARRTLSREPDPVILQGDALGAAAGLPIGGFRLYAWRNGRARAIPFDINERDANGDYVLPQGKNPDAGTGVLARNSELAYMAHDTGDRAEPAALPEGWSKAFEIETRDPLNGGKAWAYLLHFERDPPPKSPADYVSITEVKEPDPLTGKPYVILKGKYFQARNLEGSTSWYDFHGTRAAGYREKSFSDHVLVRNRLKIFGFIPFSVDEDSIWSDTPAYYDGAVRFIRRIKLKVLIAGLKIPTGIMYDVTGYDRIANIPVKVKIPAVVKAASRNAWAWYGLDMHPDAAGKYTFYSNMHTEGIPITGKSDPKKKNFGFKEKALVPSKDFWSVVTGPYGTLMRRHVTPAEFEDRGVRLYLTFVDDTEKPDPPEYYEGRVGSALNWLEIQNAPYGEIAFNSYWYYPPRFKYPEDVVTYLNILDHPITSTALEVAQPAPAPPPADSEKDAP